MDRTTPTPPDPDELAEDRGPFDVEAGFAYLAGLIRDGNGATNSLRDEMRAQAFEATQRFRRLEKKVFGNKLPPLLPPVAVAKRPPADGSSISMPSLPPPVLVSTPPLAEETQAQGGAIARLEEQVASLEALTAQQSRAAGLARRGSSIAKKSATFLLSVPGIIAIASLIAALTGLVTAIRGQAPPPPLPQPTVSR